MRNSKALNRKAVVLLSGGLDSATTLYFARSKGFKCFCLIFDYGQRHKKELECAKRLAWASHSAYEVLKINLPWKGSALLDRRVKISRAVKSPRYKTAGIPVTYVPARNIIFLSFALSYAEAIKARAIFIGSHAQDYSGYPDCRPEFYRAFDRVCLTGTKAGVEHKRIKIYTPLIDKNKSQIIRLGKSLGVPFKFTWSCYRGGIKPCGNCDSCYFRARGFSAAGLKDPSLG